MQAMNGEVKKHPKDETIWLHAYGGLYFGRARDGTARIAVTNGLPPWDERGAASFHQLQPGALLAGLVHCLGSAVPGERDGATMDAPSPEVDAMAAADMFTDAVTLEKARQLERRLGVALAALVKLR